MSVLHIVYAGPPEQRQTVKVTAMQPISAAMPEACGKFKPPLDPASVKLGLNKKPVDMSCPFRLANIPAGSILHITASTPAAAPASAAPAAVSTPAAPPAQPAAGPAPPAGQQAGSSHPTAAPVAAQQLQPQQAAPAAPAAAASRAAPSAAAVTPAQTPAPAPAAAPIPAPARPSALPAAAAATSLAAPAAPATAAATAAPAATATAAVIPAPADAAAQEELLAVCRAAGVVPAREALLTTEATLQEQAAAEEGGGGAMDVDEDNDAFYELTPEDLADIARAAEARRRQEEGGLRTQAMREAEERAKIQSYGPVAVRLRFHDGLVLQAAFRATDKLQQVKDFLAALLVDPSTPITLFITPPKQVLKDLSITLYKAGLVPAALVHCQVQGAAGAGPSLQLLRPELHSLLRTSLAPWQALPARPAHSHQLQPGATQGSTSTRAGGATGSSSNAASRALAMARQALGGGAGEAGQHTGDSTGPSGAGQGKALPKWFRKP